MKRLIRCISLILAAVLLLATPAFAAETVTPKASSYIMKTCVYLDNPTDTKIDIWFEVVTIGVMDELGACEIKIQRSSDGENWTTMRTYYPGVYKQMVDTDSGVHTGYVSYTGTSGYYYRARIVLFGENSTGRGEYITYTETLKLQ